MFRIIRMSLLVATTAAAMVAVGPKIAQADDYWDNYWNWYRNDYRHYYNRRHHRNYFQYRDDDFRFRYDPYYGRYDRGYYYDNRRYNRGTSVDVGPLHLNWR